MRNLMCSELSTRECSLPLKKTKALKTSAIKRSGLILLPVKSRSLRDVTAACASKPRDPKLTTTVLQLNHNKDPGGS